MNVRPHTRHRILPNPSILLRRASAARLSGVTLGSLGGAGVCKPLGAESAERTAHPALAPPPCAPARPRSRSANEPEIPFLSTPPRPDAV